MNREQALKILASDSSHDRFRAAHSLKDLALPEDLSLLQQVKHAETDSYVVKRLEVAIENVLRHSQIEEETFQQISEIEVDEEKIFEHARAQAIEWVSGLLLHEIGAKLGLVSLAVSREMQNYDGSKTERHIKNLQAIFNAIGELRQAANPSKYEEFDLAELINEIIELENTEKNLEFSLVGNRPLVVTSNKNLIRLALCNGIRNAIEATYSVIDKEKTDSLPIVVTWGVTDKECWISILDEGLGLINHTQNFFEIGKSTKKGHTGFGLSIAKQALETLGGTVTLEAKPTKGVKYEMRWGIKE